MTFIPSVLTNSNLNNTNVSDVILISARRVTGTGPKVYASFNWQEIY